MNQICDHYSKRNAAGQKVQRAIYKGILKKPSVCQYCHKILESLLIHGHHEDYDKPLEVIWLCHTCHKKIHRDGLLSMGL